MVKLNKIYTRTGDDGTTGLVDGSRIAKSDALMAAIGSLVALLPAAATWRRPVGDALRSG